MAAAIDLSLFSALCLGGIEDSVGLGMRAAIATHSMLLGTLPPDTTGAAASLNLLQAFVLGIVQGLTEFLPISSTAHLKVIPVALGWGDPGVTFTAVIQLGSIFAVIGYFWGDLTTIVRGAWSALRQGKYEDQNWRLAVGILLGTVPIAICGLLLKALVPDLDHSPMRSTTTIAIVSIVMALLLAVAEKVSTHKRKFLQLTLQDGIWMGLAQTLALVPGVSRSGSTLTAGLFIDLERATAARFSFLLGIPAITLAGLVELKSALADPSHGTGIMALIVGVISSAIFSYAAIAWLLRFLQTKTTWVFVWYRLAFGGAILGAIVAGRLQGN